MAWLSATWLYERHWDKISSDSITHKFFKCCLSLGETDSVNGVKMTLEVAVVIDDGYDTEQGVWTKLLKKIKEKHYFINVWVYIFKYICILESLVKLNFFFYLN